MTTSLDRRVLMPLVCLLVKSPRRDWKNSTSVAPVSHSHRALHIGLVQRSCSTPHVWAAPARPH